MFGTSVGQESDEGQGPKTFHLLVEQTNLFTRSRSWQHGEKPDYSWKKSGAPEGPVTPWPERKVREVSSLKWARVKFPELPEDRNLWHRYFGVFPSNELPDDFPGKEELLDFVAQQDLHDLKLFPRQLEVELTQTAYRREFLLTLSEWRPADDGLLAGAVATLGISVETDHPNEPIQLEDRQLKVDGIFLGMTADEYLALGPPLPSVRFRADQDTVEYAGGTELRLGEQVVTVGQKTEALTALLEPLGYSVEKGEQFWKWSNKRVQVDVRQTSGTIEFISITGNLREKGGLDLHNPVLTIHGLRPGVLGTELLAIAGEPDEVLEEEERRILRWGVWPHQLGELPGVRLEAVVKDDRVERLRGDRVEQDGELLLTWRTPVTLWWTGHFSHSNPEELRQEFEQMRYIGVTGQAPDIDRAPKTPGPNRVLEFTDRGLSIWEYPEHRRQFQLVVSEPPTLGVDLEYP